MTEEDEEVNYLGSHTFTFTEKAWYDHLWDYCKWMPNQAGEFATVAVSMWAVSEVLMVASGQRVPIEGLALPILVFAIVILLYRTYRAKRDYVPAPLIGESEEAKAIFRKQRCGWSAALAKQLLEDRINETDGALSRIDKGSEFIAPRQMDYDDYVDWLQTRPELVIRMVRSAALLCTQEVPLSIARTEGEGDLPALKREVLALSAMYERAKEAEIDWHQVLAPEDFEEIHKMVYGWTTPIRHGVHSFLKILDELANVDRQALKKGTASVPDFNIVFEKPENIDEFSRRLDQHGL